MMKDPLWTAFGKEETSESLPTPEIHPSLEAIESQSQKGCLSSWSKETEQQQQN